MRLYPLIYCLLMTVSVHAQFRQTGMVYDAPSLRSIPYKAPLTTETYRGLPARASLEQFAPSVGDQGQFGTCVGFAVGYHMRTIMHNKMISDSQGIPPAELKRNDLIFSPSYIYESFRKKDDNRCQNGMNPVDAFDWLVMNGAAPLKLLPYQCGINISDNIIRTGKGYTIKGYQILFHPNNKDEELVINSVKKSLSEGFPPMLGFSVAESFYRVKGDVWRKQSTDAGGTGKHSAHAMCIVGYDDAKYGGAFRVMNSWGTSWGDKGYVWIPYKDFVEYSLIAIQGYGPEAPELSPKPLNTIALKGNLRFQLNTGENMKATRAEQMLSYKMDQNYFSGTRFRFYVTTNTEAYMYAFASDLSGKVNKILPFADNMSPHIGSNSTVAFPSEQKVVKLDDQPGTDFLVVLYAQKPLDADALLIQMNKMRGGLSGKIKAALGDQLIDSKSIKYTSNQIGFEYTGSTAKGHVVPLMVEIGHN